MRFPTPVPSLDLFTHGEISCPVVIPHPQNQVQYVRLDFLPQKTEAATVPAGDDMPCSAGRHIDENQVAGTAFCGSLDTEYVDSVVDQA